jgi:hypothetical protein
VFVRVTPGVALGWLISGRWPSGDNGSEASGSKQRAVGFETESGRGIVIIVTRLQRLSELLGVTRASGRPSLGSGLGQPGLAHDGLSALGRMALR